MESMSNSYRHRRVNVTILYCNNTAFKLILEESMKRRHSSGLQNLLHNVPLVHQHQYNKQVHCSVKKNYVKEFSRVLNVVTLTLDSSSVNENPIVPTDFLLN